MIYRPIQQEYSPGVSLLVRTKGDPASLLGTLRERVQTLDKNMPMRGGGTVQANVEARLGRRAWAPRCSASSADWRCCWR